MGMYLSLIHILYRIGNAPKAFDELPIKQPESISVSGVIRTPLDWLEKRIDTIEMCIRDSYTALAHPAGFSIWALPFLSSSISFCNLPINLFNRCV